MTNESQLNIWDNMLGDFDKHDSSDWREKTQANYEDKMVVKVMTKLNLSNEIPLLRSQIADWSGQETSKLSFEWFHDRFHAFPIRLTAKQSVSAQNVDISDLYKRFTNTFIYKNFVEAKDLISQDEQFKSYGMIFPWIGLGSMIIHNYELPLSCTRFVRSLGTKEVVYIDQLDSVLTRLAETCVLK